MSEPQRIFLAFILCTSIYLGFQWILPPPELVETADNSPKSAATSTLDAARDTAAFDAQIAGSVPAASAPVVDVHFKAQERSFETPLLRGAVHNGELGLTKLQLVAFEDRVSNADGSAALVSLVPPVGGMPQARLEWHLEGEGPVALDFVDAKGLRLQGRSQGGLKVEVELTPRQDAYAIDYVLRITNGSSKTQHAGASVALGLVSKSAQESRQPSLFAKLWGRSPVDPSATPPAMEEVTALCDVAGSLKRKSFGDVKNAPWMAQDKAAWVGLDQQYFALAVMPRERLGGACSVRRAGEVLTSRYTFLFEPIAPGAVWERGFSLYAGPKRDAQLAQVAPELQDVIDYNLLKVPLGFLARPMVWLLNLLHTATASWGAAIMLLTVSVKLLLFPVTYKSLTSARRMQALKPELDALKVRFANDKERQQMEQLKLFKERGVNPVGGCLPMLLQMPVWITLYRTLWSDVDLYQQPFLWLHDLTAREPFPTLAIAVGALTVLQQKVTPMAMDSQQAKVMTYVMPVMLTGFMVALPSGLVLYILVNSILTILQQLAINKRAAKV